MSRNINLKFPQFKISDRMHNVFGAGLAGLLFILLATDDRVDDGVGTLGHMNNAGYNFANMITLPVALTLVLTCLVAVGAWFLFGHQHKIIDRLAPVLFLISALSLTAALLPWQYVHCDHVGKVGDADKYRCVAVESIEDLNRPDLRGF